MSSGEGRCRCRLAPVALLVGTLVSTLLAWTSSQNFAASPSVRRSSRQGARNTAYLTGRTSWGQKATTGQERPQATGAAASLTLPWGGQQSTQGEDQLSNRDWVRLYRTLGLADDASRDQVQRAAARLRRKYAEDEQALERVERANLKIMQRLVFKKEDAIKKKQQAHRLREFGTLSGPRKMLANAAKKYLPAGVYNMLEPPDMKHFKKTSGLVGFFTLLGLCVPTQASNFVGLSAASALGLIYTRTRPEPVKDEMGQVGAVQKMNIKEMGGTLAIVLGSGLLGGALTLGVAKLVDTPLMLTFLVCCSFCFWLASLFFKVYGCFEDEY